MRVYAFHTRPGAYKHLDEKGDESFIKENCQKAVVVWRKCELCTHMVASQSATFSASKRWTARQIFTLAKVRAGSRLDDLLSPSPVVYQDQAQMKSDAAADEA
ncbi:hypothetical protein AAHC03_01263 [Spirometra sp. Aus1]